MNNEAKIGIWVTGGGTMGGRAAMGMFKFLEEIGIYPDKVAVAGGVSLGALSLMGVAKNMSAKEMIDYSLSLTSKFQFTPNRKTKVGASDIEEAISTLRADLFEGSDPKMNGSKIPIVFGATNLETGQPHFFDGYYPLLDAFRQSIGNPFIFPVIRNGHGVIGDGGLSCPVGVNFLREQYGVEKTILFDIQTANNYQFGDNLDAPLPDSAKATILLANASVKLPKIGQKLEEFHFPWLISSLLHAPSTIKMLSRSSVLLLSRIIEEQIKNQRPDVVIRLEDAIGEMRDLSHRAYLRKNGLIQIESGYLAAQLQQENLIKL